MNKGDTKSLTSHDYSINNNTSTCMLAAKCIPTRQVISLDFVATLTLGSRPRQRLARLRAKRKAGNEGKCEGMNLHNPKGAFTLRVGVPMDSRMFRE
jgi:hypothetical protein